MEQPQLIKALDKIGTLYVTGTPVYLKINKHFLNTEILSFKFADCWRDDNPELYPKDFSVFNRYPYVEPRMDFYLVEDHLQCDAKVYKLRSNNEFTGELLYEATFKLDIEFIKELEFDINQSLKIMASNAYREFLRKQESDFINNFIENFVK